MSELHGVKPTKNYRGKKINFAYLHICFKK